VNFELTLEKWYILASSKSMKTALSSSLISKNRRLCVLFPGALGDFICCLPAIQTLTHKAEVDVFARSEFSGIAPDRVTVRSLERREIANLFAADGAVDGRVRSLFGNYSVIYSWMGSAQPDFVRRLQAACGGRAQIFPFRPTDARYHQAEYYFRCLHGRDSPVPNPRVLLLRSKAIAWREDFRARHALSHRPVLVIAPGSGAREKNWDEDNFIAIAEWWRDRTNGAVVVLIGLVEEERGVSARLRNVGVLGRGLDLAQAAALLVGGDVYVGNDSGITHLAAASGIRTVALFGPSDPRQWAPRGAKVTVLSRNEVCSPCAIATMKSCAHRRCLTGLDAAQVIAVLAQLPEVATLTRWEAGIRI
jgi:ADP-heptose:LPS heptosyltransferase